MPDAYPEVILPLSINLLGGLRTPSLPEYPRTNFQQENLKAYALPLQDWRVWNAYGTSLGSAGSDDLGIDAGAFATGCPYIDGGDCKTLTTTRYARITFTLPPEYVAGQSVRINAAAGMITTVASSACTIDFQVYKSARTTLKSGSDLVSTSATSINSLTFAETAFEVDGTALAPGDTLDILMAIAVTDAATGTVVRPAVAHTEVLLDIKG